jgi:hypothetical protein
MRDQSRGQERCVVASLIPWPTAKPRLRRGWRSAIIFSGDMRARSRRGRGGRVRAGRAGVCTGQGSKGGATLERFSRSSSCRSCLLSSIRRAVVHMPTIHTNSPPIEKFPADRAASPGPAGASQLATSSRLPTMHRSWPRDLSRGCPGIHPSRSHTSSCILHAGMIFGVV